MPILKTVRSRVLCGVAFTTAAAMGLVTWHSVDVHHRRAELEKQNVAAADQEAAQAIIGYLESHDIDEPHKGLTIPWARHTGKEPCHGHAKSLGEKGANGGDLYQVSEFRDYGGYAEALHRVIELPVAAAPGG